MADNSTAGGWASIDAAPRDGTEVRLLVEVTAHWQKGVPAVLVEAGWKLHLDSAKATHWKSA